ncbi:macrolide ABC transporter ATP-binding protein [Massilia sp. Root351]|jgi:macrolide transport system ATP-binding/permease protein|uniref:MacB family efflux pump subunit n=1 Tax=Massilia sp. Root351 TaxID=1736522 RepID=UPI00070B5322|nr:MacB family efflux pump subunit [Massilia sp. Root351]KQV90058.1 macrolide ABC transporter ATP-binding protein [Massilia sp. Root351]
MYAPPRAPQAGATRLLPAAAQPLIALRGLRKRYGGENGSPAVEVLRGVTLDIHAGEFVAIVGASGSGKSTLMHLLGCLDRPSEGSYRFAGQDVADLGADQLAWLRREAFGFVFQGYHLIASETARENVELPAIYAGMPEHQRKERAGALLRRLGMGERLEHRPSQLSGGQQQRVSIARALMNGGRILLADEPTGALDSASGAEVMALLNELADAGHTIILITHDRSVAAQARRVIEIRDGAIVGDSGAAPSGQGLPAPDMASAGATGHSAASFWADLREAARAAWRVMWINRFRTGLTLLGIVIGVASVIVMLAVGLGAKQRVVAQLGAFGSNLMYMSSIGASSRMPGRSITLADLDAVATLPNVAHVLPNVTGNQVVRFGGRDVQTYVRGSGPALPEIQTWPVARGGFFTPDDERDMANVAVLGHKLARELMPDVADPVGKVILIGNLPLQVIGVMSEKGAISGDRDEDNLLILPFSTAGLKVFGQREPTYTVMAVDDVSRVAQTQASVEALMLERHGLRDFDIGNAAASIAAEAKTGDTMTLMLSLIAAVSLVVGGIGVMNVMLMTVRERTREIGIRMATGARRRDILRQFLTEAVLVTLTGGSIGVAVGLAVGSALLWWDVALIFSLSAIAGAFGCALVTGLVFGFMPARTAAALDPVQALASD